MTSGDFQLLLGLARSDAISPEPGSVDHREMLLAVERLVASADLCEQPLAAVICRSARRLGLWDELSEPARAELDRVRLEVVARGLHQRRWLADTLGELERCDITCVLLKAAAFQGTLYADDAPRLGGDIDLLVRAAEFDAACRVLGNRARPARSRRDRRASHAANYEAQFLTGGPFDVLVEIHRGLTIPHVFDIDHEQLFANSVSHPIYTSEAVRMLDPEDALLHLAVHGFRHLRLETHALLDVHEIWNRRPPDSAVLRSRATAWGARGALFMLLEAASVLAGTPVHGDLLATLRPGTARERAIRQIYRFATERDLGLLDPGYRLIQLMGLAAVPDRRAGVLRYGMRYAGWRALDLWERLRVER